MKSTLNIGADGMVVLAQPPAAKVKGSSGKVHISMDYPQADRDAGKLDPRVILYLRLQEVLKETWTAVEESTQDHLKQITLTICNGLTRDCLEQIAEVRSGKIPSPFGNGSQTSEPAGDGSDQADGGQE